MRDGGPRVPGLFSEDSLTALERNCMSTLSQGKAWFRLPLPDGPTAPTAPTDGAGRIHGRTGRASAAYDGRFPPAGVQQTVHQRRSKLFFGRRYYDYQSGRTTRLAADGPSPRRRRPAAEQAQSR